MPVTRLGDWCDRCGVRPAQAVIGICRPCELLLSMFGRNQHPASDSPRPDRSSGILPAESPLFAAELERWLMGGEAA